MATPVPQSVPSHPAAPPSDPATARDAPPAPAADGAGGAQTPTVPRFAPLHAGHSRGHRLRRLVHPRPRLFAAALAGLAVAAAVLAVRSPGGAAPGESARPAAQARPPGATPRPSARPPHTARHTASPLVSAPVRIADPATLRLLTPGDRVDVLAVPLAADHTDRRGSRGAVPTARLVARNVPVADVPRPRPDAASGVSEAPQGEDVEAGGLVLLTVPRSTAAVLTGAAATARLSLLLR